MKKNGWFFGIICSFAVLLTACTSEPAPLKNLIAPKELTQDQQDIVELLSSNKQEILLFDFTTETPYKSMNYWVEIYENGELIDQPAGINTYGDEAKPLKGQLAILINHDSGISWSFTTSENGSRVNHVSETLPFNPKDLGRGYAPIREPIEIEAGKEIVLYTSIYSANGLVCYSDPQIYIDNPERLNAYPYAHIIKCRFE